MFACYHFPVYVILLLIALRNDGANAQELNNAASDFSKYIKVQPSLHVDRTKRDMNGIHHKEVTVTVPIDGEDYVLDMKLNEDLISENHVFRYKEGGKTVVKQPTIEEIGFCQYSGTVRGKPGSRVALSTCHGLRGVIDDGHSMKYIEPAAGAEIQSSHYLYDHRDLIKNSNCGYVGASNNQDHDLELMVRYSKGLNDPHSRISRFKRSWKDSKIHEPFNADQMSRYVELALVVDHSEFVANGRDVNTAHRTMQELTNIINMIYSPLNIFITLVGVEVWNEGDEIELSEESEIVLFKFLSYRKQLLQRIPNDFAQLLTHQQFRNAIVGKSLYGICTYEFSGGVVTNHSKVLGIVAGTIAHSLGHSLGMRHDEEDKCTCSDEKCIMSTTFTSIPPTHWSNCSREDLSKSFERGMDYCLKNKPKRLFRSPTCGNGFVEDGEECDCGTPSDGSSYGKCAACCHPDHCVLRTNATCAAGGCCDLETCLPKPAGTECRTVIGECDLPEVCSGHSGYCPEDLYKMDTTPCGHHTAFCMNGSCRSHTDQCKTLWGPTGENANELCYKVNIRGTRYGNCWYDPVRHTYEKCSAEDVLCGRLQCQHLSEQLRFGLESTSIFSAYFINNNGSVFACRSAIIDMGLSDVDPGLVPDGARCGVDKMCRNQKCVSVATVLAETSKNMDSVCPSECSGRGVCNSAGRCHCEAGFAPPLCAPSSAAAAGIDDNKQKTK